MKLHRSILLLLLGTLLFCSCNNAPRNTTYDPAKVDFQAAYNPFLDGIVYPSLVLSHASYQGDNTLNFFTISVTAPTDNAVLRVEFDSTNLNYLTVYQQTLPHRNTRYILYPKLKWRYDRLRELRQQGTTDFTVTCYINDEKIDIKNLRLSYRSINECPLSLSDTSGKSIDCRWLFCAYVNEDHPQIDEMLSEMLTQGVVTRFTGYQTKNNPPEQQVKAIWYYALNRGITYSSISCTSNPSKRANTQHIRLFDEVYRYRQANCVDACVFFASIMRKIGLKPVIFVEPCHAYLGYYTDRQRKNLALLETTITGWVNFPELDHVADSNGMLPEKSFAKVAKYLTPKQQSDYLEGTTDLETVKHLVADSLFRKASAYDREAYNANRNYFRDSTNHQYRELDIEALRKLVQPIN